MKNDKRSAVGLIYLLFDLLVLAATYWLTYWFKLVLLDQQNYIEIFELYIKSMTFVFPVFLISYMLVTLYSNMRTQSKGALLFLITEGNIMGTLFLTLLLFFVKIANFSRLFLVYFAILDTVFMFIERVIVGKFIDRSYAKGRHQSQVVIVGYSETAKAYLDRVLANPQWGYHIVGILDDEKKVGHAYKGVAVIGSTEGLSALLAKNETDEIVICLKLTEHSKLKTVVNTCEKSGVHTKFIPDYMNVLPTQPYTEDMQGLPVINIRYVPLMSFGNAFIKRTMDIVGSLFAIILFSPVMLIVAILVKTTSKGGVIFKQERVGKHNRPFKMYKFRSMVVQTDESEKDKWTTKNDARVTKVGAFIRKTSIDELPQFFNVLKGDMSLIGPRPERPFFVEKFKEEIPRYMVKHQVRPGITGWAQVNGWRGDTSISERIACDLYYIEHWSLKLDIKILFLTFFKGFVNKNAY